MTNVRAIMTNREGSTLLESTRRETAHRHSCQIDKQVLILEVGLSERQVDDARLVGTVFYLSGLEFGNGLQERRTCFLGR